jgi:hypothetical protein
MSAPGAVLRSATQGCLLRTRSTSLQAERQDKGKANQNDKTPSGVGANHFAGGASTQLRTQAHRFTMPGRTTNRAGRPTL